MPYISGYVLYQSQKTLKLKKVARAGKTGKRLKVVWYTKFIKIWCLGKSAKLEFIQNRNISELILLAVVLSVYVYHYV